LYASVATDLDPGLCATLCAKNIPVAANSSSGQNYTRTNIASLDPLLETVDAATDDSARIRASKAADRILADQQVSLPLDPLPNIGVWSSRITGVRGDNPVFAIFWNLSQWQAQ
jgi:ABC-type transport system substrate-binding protein